MSRTRSTASPPVAIPHQMTGVAYNGTLTEPNKQVGNVANTTYYSDSSSTEIIDVVTPMFKDRMRQGEIFNNYLKLTKIVVVSPKPGPYKAKNMNVIGGVTTGQIWEGTWPLSNVDLGVYLEPYEDPVFINSAANLRSKMVTEAHSRVADANLLSLASIGEADKTVASVASILKRALRVAKAAKRLEFKALRRELSKKELTDRYMEIRYAIRPLLYDISGVIKAIKTPKNKDRFTARAKGEFLYEKEDEIVRTTNSGSATVTIKRTLNVRTVVSAGVLSRVSHPQIQNWGLNQIAESVWELLPFSFIIDWFWNVGNTISAHAPHVGIEKLASWVTVTTTTTRTNSLVSAVSALTGYQVSELSWSGCNKTSIETYKERLPVLELDYLPTLTLRLDMLKLLDLTIILRGLAKFR